MLLFTAIVTSGAIKPTPQKVTESNFYACGISKIYYDSKYHAALKRCKSGIKSMTKERAKSLGKRLCKCRD